MAGERGMTEVILVAAIGTYSGQGEWHDSAAVSHRYKVEMRIEQLPSGDFRQWFKHTFFEEGNSVIEQTVEYSFTKNGIFNLSLVGTPIQGRGYCSQDACHYSLPVQQNLVEVTQFFHEDGKIRILGSAEKNAQGNYIWWEERVARQRNL